MQTQTKKEHSMSSNLDFEKIAGIMSLIAPAAVAGGAIFGGKSLLSNFGKRKNKKNYSMERPFDYKFKDKPWLGKLDKATDTVVHNPGDWTSFRSLMETYTPAERMALKEEGLLRYNHVWNPGDWSPTSSPLPQASLDVRGVDVPVWKNAPEPKSIKSIRDGIISATQSAAKKVRAIR